VRPPVFPLLSLAIKAFNRAHVAPGINPSLYFRRFPLISPNSLGNRPPARPWSKARPPLLFLSLPVLWTYLSSRTRPRPSLLQPQLASIRTRAQFHSAVTSVSAAAGAIADGEVPRLPPSSPVHAWLISLPLSLLQGHLVASGPSCAVTPSAGPPPELAVDIELPLQRLPVNFVLAPVASAW
jgi:hypothetical protein